MNQTMLRVRDAQVSTAFYRDVLGMTLLDRYDFEAMQFSLYFMGYLGPGVRIPPDAGPRAQSVFGRPALIELTHDWGTESDPAFAGYHDGNAEPKGFGHIGISVPDVYAACASRTHPGRIGRRVLRRPILDQDPRPTARQAGGEFGTAVSAASAPRRKTYAFLMVNPPSTARCVPVMYCDAGSTKFKVACATSSGSA